MELGARCPGRIVLCLLCLLAGPLRADIDFEDRASSEIKQLLTTSLIYCRRDVSGAELSAQPDPAVQEALATCLTQIEGHLDQVSMSLLILPVCRAYPAAWDTHRRDIEARVTLLRDQAQTLSPEQMRVQLEALMRFVDDGFHPPGRFDCS